MCLYRGIYYHDCGHSRFLLYNLCDHFLNQLQRINNPEERERYAIPFDGAGCEPRVRLKADGSVDTLAYDPVKGWSNVVQWEHNMVEVCYKCQTRGFGGSETG
ncbi:hypothetical protein PENDEC_c002G03411 [Penicillium decumbens]|uniref:Uncharacterized protein n=1 Tax=Penicillium decumbens TaxID=69771 RepID=A0A1V6PLB1_PENDC|nr:hypothetical protein PENDEC_c002G03411 [Penicillium decumbens]